MRRVLIVTLLAAALCLVASGVVYAQTQPDAVIALHAVAKPTKGGGCATPPTMECTQYNTVWPVDLASDVYLVVAKGVAPGIGGVSCGVDYTVGNYCAWTMCASGLEFTNTGPNGLWPAAGGGNRVTWDSSVDCQLNEIGTSGIHAVAGFFYFYAYSADVFQITRNNNLDSGPELRVADCNNAETDLPLSAAGAVGYGLDGYNPCDPAVPVEATSWGRIKSQY